MKKILCTVLCFSLLFSLASCKSDEKAPENQAISYNLPAEPKTLDPQVAADYAAHIVLVNLFEGLTRLGPDGAVKPGAAQSWSANADHTVFTFTLRPDAMWAEWVERWIETGEDGKQTNKKETHPAERVTAGDFVYGLRRAVDPATNSEAAGSLFAIKNAEAVHNGELSTEELGVRAQSDDTLVIELEYSYEEFPALMALTAAMPCNQTFFDYTKGQYGLETETILGNGPYVMANRYAWDHQKTLALTRSDSYKGEEPAVPLSLSFTIGETQEDPVAAVTGGTVDACSLPGGSLDAAAKAGLSVTSFEDTTWGLCFNLADDTFRNLSIRKGFLQSIDRNYLLGALPAGYNTADDIIPPATTLGGLAYREQAGTGMLLGFDENARSLIQEGLTQEGLKNSNLSGLSILCPDDPGIRKMVSNLIQIWNRQLGVYFNMEPVPADEIPDRLKRGTYQIAFAPLRAQDDGPGEFLEMFSSGYTANPVGLNNAAFDSLLASAEDLAPEAAAPVYADAERFLCDNAVFYPICYEKRYFAAAANVSGILFLPYNSGIDFSRAVKVPD